MYSGDKKVVRGAFTDWNHKPKGNFAVTPVSGDVLVVEVVVPVAAAAKPIAVVVGSVVHHYIGTRLTGSHGATHPSVAGRARRQDSDFGDSGACNVNSKCPVARGYENAARGIAMVLDSDGDRFCSGSMINNVEQDGKQFFLTADHCMEDEDGDTCIVLFNYESDECANPRTEPSTADTAQGMRPVASNGYNDFDIIFGHLSSFIAPQARRVMYRTRSPCLSAAVRCLQSDVTPNFPCQAFDTRWRLYGASPFGTTMLSADKTSVKLQGGGYCVRQLRHGRLGRFFPFFPGASPVLPPHTRHIDMLDFIFELVVAPIQCWVLIDACIPML